jgi:FAD/FMN-containing dehydrogenase
MENLSKTLSHSQLNAQELRQLASSFAGEIILPADPTYTDARLVWNGMIDRYPALILRCTNTQDVVSAVQFARQNNLPIAVRGGGHNVAGLAVTDSGVVIDLSRMQAVEVDPNTQTAWAEGGATIGALDASTQMYGLSAPMGVVSETGIAGLTLGGGMGWLRNKYGLSCDNLIGAEVVTAEGQVLAVNEQENADLLWGLRGGGGNFGIVTKFLFRLYPTGPEVFFTFVFHDGEKMEQHLRFFRDYTASAPDEVSVLAFAGVFPPGAEIFPQALHGQSFLAFGAMYAGTAQQGAKVLHPLSDFAEPLIDFSGIMPYTQAQKMFDEDYPAHTMRYYWKSLNLNELSDAVIQRFVTHAHRQPSPYSTTDLWHIGGAIKRGSTEQSAYFGRHAAYLMNPEANWVKAEDDEANIRWVREFVADMQEFSDGSRYLNFAGFQEEGDDMMRKAFGEHYQRLVALKNKYDPHNIFRLNQNIKPTT